MKIIHAFGEACYGFHFKSSLFGGLTYIQSRPLSEKAIVLLVATPCLYEHKGHYLYKEETCLQAA
jgi:hypothetical protein